MDAESLYENMCVVQCLLEGGPVTFVGIVNTYQTYVSYIALILFLVKLLWLKSMD